MTVLSNSAKLAIVNDEKRYFTGIPCVHGHVAERFAGNRNCVECDSVRRLKKRATKNASFLPEKTFAELVDDRVKEITAKNKNNIVKIRKPTMKRVVIFHRPMKNSNGHRIMNNHPVVVNDVTLTI